MKDIETMKQQYAQIIIEAGVNLKKGECLRIKTGAATYDFARRLAEHAYAVGAKHVLIIIDDMTLLRSRLNLQNEEDITFVPSYEAALDEEIIREGWSHIRIDNTDERGVLADVPTAKLGSYMKATGKFHEKIKSFLMNNGTSWCVVCVPSPRWAESILGKGAGEEDLWRFLSPILHLNEENPRDATVKRFKATEARADRLTSLGLRKLHFTSSVTDLTIGLRENHLYTGGGDTRADGRKFYPNIPSEEIFTTPDYLQTEGYVKTTRPISLMESRVENATFRFEKGVVVEATAEVGEAVLKEYLSIDEGARRVGEIALVDQSSPIAMADTVFESILYDENASCHFALGAGYPTCLDLKNPNADAAELLSNGCNQSQVHTDFMFGSDDMNLTGYDAEGRTYIIMKDGLFTPEFA